MKERLRLFKRGNVFYFEDTETRKQSSLGTKNRTEAVRLLEAKRQSLGNPAFTQLLIRTCLSSVDPLLASRTWQTVMEEYSGRTTGPTADRSERAFESKSFDWLRNKKLVETAASDFLSVLRAGNVSTHHYLRRLHNLAVGLGWLSHPVLAPKFWPKMRFKEKRGITQTEHELILASERNRERKHFYETLWEIGAAQSDAAGLTASNIDWSQKTLSYQRQKTGTWSHLLIGPSLERILRELPANGLLFPVLSTHSANDRAAEFYRRCKILGISGVSLHSYRYAWAERAKSVGFPERFAQIALGHNSKAVHRAYAKGAHVLLPSLDSYANAHGTSKASKGEGI
jgi:integrase